MGFPKSRTNEQKAHIDSVEKRKIRKIGAINNNCKHLIPVDKFLLYGSIRTDDWGFYENRLQKRIQAIKEEGYTDLHCYTSGYSRLTLEIIKWCHYFGLGFSAYYYDLNSQEYYLYDVFEPRTENPARKEPKIPKTIGTMMRHEMPVDDYFLSIEVLDPTNLDSYEKIIKNKAKEIKDHGYTSVNLYLSGFYKITVMVVKWCVHYGLNLDANHYNKEQDNYLVQKIL